MTPERWKTIKAILNDALEVPLSDRSSLLGARCGNDADLRREVEELLAVSDHILESIDFPEFAATVDAPAVTASPGQLIGPYRIHELIGHGGMGEVYRATDTRLHREVAIKSLKTDLAAFKRFDRQMLHEARAAAVLGHPNIVAVFDVLDHDGRTHIVMELLQGESLASRLASAPLSDGQLVSVGLGLAAALVHAHERGLVHCDIKPGNVFLLPQGDVKVLDFGLARPLILPVGEAPDDDGDRRAEPDGSVTAALLRHAGTPRYMAPEQLDGHPPTAQSDLYSVGLVLMEASGAWRAGDASAEPLACLDRVEQNWLRPILSRALDQRPAHRYTSVRELKQELEEAAALAGLAAPSARRRWSPAFTAVATCLVVAVTAIGWWLWRMGVDAPEAVLVPRPITTHGESFPVTSAALSPDGSTLAYSDARGIWFRRLDPGTTTLARDAPASRVLRWASDSSVLCWRPGQSPVAVGTDGSVRPVDEPAFGRYPSSDPTVAVEVSVGGELIVRTTTQARTLPGTDASWRAVWSPEGRFVLGVAWVHAAPPDTSHIELRAYELDTNAFHRLVKFPSVARFPFAALPDGRVWYVLPQMEGSALWELRVRPATGELLRAPRQLAAWPGLTITALSASRNGRRIALLASQVRQQILVADWPPRADAVAFRRLSADDAPQSLRFWANDSSTLFFEASSDEKRTLHRAIPGGDTATIVGESPRTMRAAAMTTTGEILHETVDPRVFTADIVRRPSASTQAGGATWTRVAGGGVECGPRPLCLASDPFWSPSPRRLFTLNPATGQTAVVATVPDGAFNVTVSPSGREVAYIVRNGPVTIQRLSDGVKRHVDLTSVIALANFDDPWPQVGSLAWSSDEKGFFFSHRPLSARTGDVSCTLYYISAEGRGRELATNACKALPSPDGRFLAIETTQAIANVWSIDRAVVP